MQRKSNRSKREMQHICKKILKIFIGLSFVFVQLANAQSVSQELNKADLLFGQKKYTEALPIYEKLLESQQIYSPAMLLKMAYIREGMIPSDYTTALFYLNLYYQHLPESRVLEKITELADKNKLAGYKLSDVEYLLANYKKYHFFVILSIIALFASGLAYIYFSHKKGNDVLYYAILFSLLMSVFFYVYNVGFDKKKGIVKKEKVFLMKSPSAAGELLDTVEKGNCLEIIEKQDIWYKVKWQNREETVEAYVRESGLYLLN
ncbi:MAG: SH3 domain-containing protein [Bacteroidetes bacterium]|nr:MAG: SH3 domain-containing protein [Bacteroidota bacterium]